MTNGEKYTTAAERSKVFAKFCAEHKCRTCKFKRAHDMLEECCLHWLEAEAEVLRCPFCDGELKLSESIEEPNGEFFHCKCCGFDSPLFDCEEDKNKIINKINSMNSIKSKREAKNEK